MMEKVDEAIEMVFQVLAEITVEGVPDVLKASLDIVTESVLLKRFRK